VSHLETLLESQLALAGIDKPEREWRFHATRRWRFDFAWPKAMVAAEVEGGTWVGGRHTRGSGFERDAEKYNAAALLGWRVLRFTARTIQSGQAVAEIEKALGGKP
jgi:very-short-patch-repair endonuclease